MEDISNCDIRLKDIYTNNRRPKENLEAITKFLRKNKLAGRKIKTIALEYGVFQFFSEWCEEPISQLTEDSILNFLEHLESHTYKRNGREYNYSKATIQSYKVVLRKFFSSIGREDIANQFILTKLKRETIEKRKLLTKSDIEALIVAAQLPRDKAMIATLYESGCRKGEILSCCVQDVDFNENGCKLTFPEGKTGKRTVQLVFAASYLRAWIEAHPIKIANETNPEAKLFVSMYSEHGGLGENGFYYQIQKIAKRAGITKRVNPHSFRHARATELAEHMTEQQLKKYLGWTQASNMPAIYVHDPDADNAVLNMYGLQSRETEKNKLEVIRCPRCKEINPETSAYCGKCGMPLKDNSIKQLETEQDTFETEFSRLIAKYPNILDALAKYKKND